MFVPCVLRLLHYYKEGEERSEDPDAQWKGKHKVYYNTKEKQYMKATNQHKTLNIKREN